MSRLMTLARRARKHNNRPDCEAGQEPPRGARDVEALKCCIQVIRKRASGNTYGLCGEGAVAVSANGAEGACLGAGTPWLTIGRGEVRFMR
jgi:hypothetical protein